jgi:hypothetical protein
LLLATLDTRVVLALAGAGVACVAVASAWVLRNAWIKQGEGELEPLPELAERLDGAEQPVPAGAQT